MLLHSLTPTQIHKEVKEDYAVVMASINRKRNPIRRLLLQGNKYPSYVHDTSARTKNGNCWHYLVTALNKEKTKHPFVTLWTTYETPWGRGAFRIYPTPLNPCGRVFNYTPHFFSRFHERFVTTHTKEGFVTPDTVKGFMCDNLHVNLRIKRNENNRFEGQIKDGYIFGDYLGNEVFLVKTFVNYDKLFDDQKFSYEYRVHDVLMAEKEEYRKEHEALQSGITRITKQLEKEFSKSLHDLIEERRKTFSLFHR